MITFAPDGAYGHPDHIAIQRATERADELAREAITTVPDEDFGAVRVLNFDDPDGMACECAIWADGAALTMSESTVEDYVSEPA